MVHVFSILEVHVENIKTKRYGGLTFINSDIKKKRGGKGAQRFQSTSNVSKFHLSG